MTSCIKENFLVLPEYINYWVEKPKNLISQEILEGLKRIEEIYQQSFQRFFFSLFNTPRVLGKNLQTGNFFIGLEKCAVCLRVIHENGENHNNSSYCFTCRNLDCLEAVNSYQGLEIDLCRLCLKSQSYIEEIQDQACR